MPAASNTEIDDTVGRSYCRNSCNGVAAILAIESVKS
jgi:hypothetical protein